MKFSSLNENTSCENCSWETEHEQVKPSDDFSVTWLQI